MTARVEFYRHHLGPRELASIGEVIHSLFLTTGPKTRQFEAAFAELLGVEHAVGVASCTQALMLTLTALGVGPGDEVITTPQTFIASANAIMHCGATPVFADIDPVTANISPAAVKSAITARTKAIVPVHLYGQLCDMPALRQIADEARLALIEDAAHCVEGRLGQVGPGQLGDAACFSFYATKNITCGEGGAVATRDAALAERIAELRLHGMNKSAADRYSDRLYNHWDMLSLGYKANLGDMQAALLLPQLPGIAERLARREAIAQRYEQAFGALPGIDFPRSVDGAVSARHLFTLWIGGGQRDKFLAEMGQAGVGVAVNYRAIHLLTFFTQRFGLPRGSFPQAERVGDQTASIPLYPALTDDEVLRVIETVTRWAQDNHSALTR